MLSIGSRRECFFDEYLINTELTSAEFRVHEPIRHECVLVHDAPWEGDGCNYHNIVKDDGLYRMYYLGWSMLAEDQIVVCYAESTDGLHWVKPSLGLFEYRGSKDTNIILTREFAVSGLRMVAGPKGKVIAAGKSGKFKTAASMVGLCVWMAFPGSVLLGNIVTALIVITTVYSGVEYFIQNWNCLWD